MWRLLVMSVLLEPLLAGPSPRAEQLQPRSRRQTQVIQNVHIISKETNLLIKLPPFILQCQDITLSFMIVAQATGKCHEYEYAGFFCVPIFQCSNDNLIKPEAAALYDPRCSNFMTRCCMNSRKRVAPAKQLILTSIIPVTSPHTLTHTKSRFDNF